MVRSPPPLLSVRALRQQHRRCDALGQDSLIHSCETVMRVGHICAYMCILRGNYLLKMCFWLAWGYQRVGLNFLSSFVEEGGKFPFDQKCWNGSHRKFWNLSFELWGQIHRKRVVNKLWGDVLAVGYGSEQGAAVGVWGDGFCWTEGRGTSCDGADVTLLPGAPSHSPGAAVRSAAPGLHCTGGRQVTSGLQLWQRASPASPGVTARAGEPFPVPTGALACLETGGCLSLPQRGETAGQIANGPHPSEHQDVGAQWDGGGNHGVPDSEQRFEFGSPTS